MESIWQHLPCCSLHNRMLAKLPIAHSPLPTTAFLILTIIFYFWILHSICEIKNSRSWKAGAANVFFLNCKVWFFQYLFSIYIILFQTFILHCLFIQNIKHLWKTDICCCWLRWIYLWCLEDGHECLRSTNLEVLLHRSFLDTGRGTSDPDRSQSLGHIFLGLLPLCKTCLLRL